MTRGHLGRFSRSVLIRWLRIPELLAKWPVLWINLLSPIVDLPPQVPDAVCPNAVDTASDHSCRNEGFTDRDSDREFGPE